MTDTAAHRGIPVPALQVIGAGFGRTGTLSTRAALVRLGCGPCDHMVENHEHLERFALWDEVLRRKTAGEPIDWRPLLTGFQAIVDWPGAYFWRELTAAHRYKQRVIASPQPPRLTCRTVATLLPPAASRRRGRDGRGTVKPGRSGPLALARLMPDDAGMNEEASP